MAKAGKTHKATAKRLKVTKTGKFMQSKGWRSHLLTNKGRVTKKNRYGKELGATVNSAKLKRKTKSLIPFKLRKK